MAAVVGFAAAPMLLQAYGADMYGVWVATTSALGLFVFSDLGITSGLVAVISAEKSNNNSAIKQLISTAAASLWTIGVVLALLFVLVASFTHLPMLLLLDDHAEHAAAGAVMLVTGLIFFLSIPANSIAQLQLALGEGFIAEYFRIAALAVALVLTAIACANFGDFYVAVLAYSLTPVIFQSVNWWYFFKHRRADLSPAWSAASRAYLKPLAGVSSIFVAITILNLLTVAFDPALLARFTEIEEAARYGLIKQIYSPLYLAVALPAAFWPELIKKSGEGDIKWVNATVLKLTLILTVVCFPVLWALVLFGNSLMTIWLKGAVAVEPNVFLAFSTFWAAYIVSLPLTYRFLEQKLVKTLLFVTGGHVVVALVIKCFVLMAAPSVLNMAWANAISQIVFLILLIFGAFMHNGAIAGGRRGGERQMTYARGVQDEGR
jgi:O-antigen/teichoic acid export membrane protein